MRTLPWSWPKEVGSGARWRILDGRWRFETHFKGLGPRVAGPAVALRRLHPKLEGPGQKCLQLHARVVRSMAVYGAPVWADAFSAHNIRVLRATQRMVALRAIRDCRIVFAAWCPRRRPWCSQDLCSGSVKRRCSPPCTGSWQRGGMVEGSVLRTQRNAEIINLAGGSKTSYEFPDNFLFGVSTAAAQIEGAWNIDGRSPSIWDHLVHTNPNFVKDGSNADVASDSYHLYKRDAEMVKELGVNIYRFSISWSRVLPTGLSNYINPMGLKYYDNLINELIKYNVTPMVTIYHWDLPQKLQNIGGWTNAHIIDYYTDYARILFDNFAHKVKYWVTFNEPMQTCLEGYGGTYRAPALNRHGIAEYLCTHNLLKAHASVYYLFKEKYSSLLNGQIGMSLDSNWAEPKTNTQKDRDAAELYLRTHVGWYAHPIYSAEGNYPPELIKLVDAKSAQQNYTRSRLPKFTAEEVAYIKGTADFFGLNHYTTYLLSMAEGEVGAIPSHENDVGIIRVQDPIWPSESSSAWLKVVPFGFRRLLKWITNTYKDMPIIVTENGYADFNGLEDTTRVSYYKHYLNALLHSIHEDRSNVQGYFAWSLMDNFEWDDGYVSRFGLYLVDFDSPNKTRTAKQSAKLYSKVIASRRLPDDYDPDDFSAFKNAGTRLFLTPALLSLCLHRLFM